MIKNIDGIKDIAKKLYKTSNPSTFCSEAGLIEQTEAIEGDVGIIYALVVGEDGNPTVLAYTVEKYHTSL